MKRTVLAALDRVRAIAAAPLADIEEELRHAREADLRWIVGACVLTTALIGVLLAFH